VKTNTIVSGFNSDQKTPNDMLRYRTLKSFRTNSVVTKPRLERRIELEPPEARGLSRKTQTTQP